MRSRMSGLMTKRDELKKDKRPTRQRTLNEAEKDMLFDQ